LLQCLLKSCISNVWSVLFKRSIQVFRILGEDRLKIGLRELAVIDSGVGVGEDFFEEAAGTGVELIEFGMFLEFQPRVFLGERMRGVCGCEAVEKHGGGLAD